MYTSPVLKEMTEQQKAVEAALTKWGFQSIWANGKGGGFWVKGEGYKSLDECVKLINNTIDIFFMSERERIVSLIKGIDTELLICIEPNDYYNGLQRARAALLQQRDDLAALDFPKFVLPPAPNGSESAEVSDLRADLKRLRKLQHEAGDRRDWEAMERYEAEADELEAELNALISK